MECGSASVFEAPAGVAGLNDVAMVGEPVEPGGGRLGNHFPTPLKSYEMACLGLKSSRLRVNFEHPRNFEWPHARSHPAVTRREIKRLSIDLPENDIERAYDRRDIGKHVTAGQKVHRLQMGE